MFIKLNLPLYIFNIIGNEPKKHITTKRTTNNIYSYRVIKEKLLNFFLEKLFVNIKVNRVVAKAYLAASVTGKNSNFFSFFFIHVFDTFPFSCWLSYDLFSSGCIWKANKRRYGVQSNWETLEAKCSQLVSQPKMCLIPKYFKWKSPKKWKTTTKIQFYQRNYIDVTIHM